MSTLHNIQEQFSAAMLGDDGNQHDAELQNTTFSVEEMISPGSISSYRRLNIYRNNMTISLREALAAIYSVTKRLVGEEFFKLLANEYTRRYPSLSGNLHDFGNHFSDFVRQFKPAEGLLYLGDVAKLEWAYHTVFHAADCSVFDIKKLQAVPTESYNGLFFKLNPASQLIHSPYPILRIWHANQQENIANESEEPTSGTISLDEGEDFLLILRKDLDIEFHSLRPCEFNFLQALQQNKNFFDACDDATAINPECNVGELFQKFILSQTIIGFEVG